MSINKPRRVGAPAFPERRPGLRLVKNPDGRPSPEPDPELKAIIDDLRRRDGSRRERIEPEGKDAA